MDINMSKEVKDELARKRKTGFDRIIDGFKFSSQNKPQRTDRVYLIRDKMVTRIEEQLQLIMKPDSNYLSKTKRVRNKDGEIEERVYMKRVNRWWFEEKGKIYLQIKYGTTVLEIKKGKPSIEVSGYKELEDVLVLLRESVENGELDNMLKDVSNQISMKFK